MTTVLSPRALNRALLARQYLLRRAEVGVPAAIEHLVGLQSQAPDPPYVGLWTRVADFRAEDLSTLIADRQAVRIVTMRGTIHLLTAADCATVRPMVQPFLDKTLSGAFRRLTEGLDTAAVADAARELVERTPHTYAELGARLAERWPDHDPSGLGHVARFLLPLVQVPPRGLWGRGGPAAHTTAEHWLGVPMSTDRTPDTLVLRYLAAFGPASAADVQAWSGLTRLREVLERLRPRLVSFATEQGTELFDLPDAPRPTTDTPAPVRFLPQWDNLLLSHADRTRVLPEEFRRHLASPNGLLPGTVLVQGFVRASWKLTSTRAAARLTVTPFRALSGRDTSAVRAEAVRLLAFLVPDADRDVQIAAVPD